MTESKDESAGPFVVYTIVSRERDGRKFWVRIGTAFRNRDGSLNAILDAVPTNGTLHIRAQRAGQEEPTWPEPPRTDEKKNG